MNIEYKLLKHQRAFLESTKKFTVLLCGRGAGKTYIASLLAAMKLIQGERVIVFAQDYKALSENLFTEILRRLDELIPGKYEFNRAKMKLTFGTGTLYGLSYENVEAARGYTEISTTIFDEMALAPANILDTVSFCMRGTLRGVRRGQNITPHMYAMTTPRMFSWFNRFVEDNAENIELIRATTLDNKFISEDQIEFMRSMCTDESMLRQELYGELVEDQDAGALFTFDLLGKTSELRDGLPYSIGIDCSGLGTDDNVVVARNSSGILRILRYRTIEPSKLCTEVLALIHSLGTDKLEQIAIDEAYGLDLAYRLRDSGYSPILVPFGGKPVNSAYQNKRAELYFRLKGELERGLYGLTPELKKELSMTRYVQSASGKLLIIPKAEIRTNLGHSPDTADALALTCNATLALNPRNRVRDKRAQCRFMLDE